VPLDPSPELPLRTQAYRARRLRGHAPPVRHADLLARAGSLIDRAPRPQGAAFVHGDLWHGNTLWSGDTLIVIIDRDCAGSGHPGADLRSLHCDAAIMHGQDAADLISAGWTAATGREPEHSEHWTSSQP
jgi:aminoglycoside phosphotransferase (APT) family kinase protein